MLTDLNSRREALLAPPTHFSVLGWAGRCSAAPSCSGVSQGALDFSPAPQIWIREQPRACPEAGRERGRAVRCAVRMLVFHLVVLAHQVTGLIPLCPEQVSAPTRGEGLTLVPVHF